MFTITTGSFHPDLELALVKEVREREATDPLTPLAIIVPSEILRRRLQWLICIEHQCSLLDVHFLTFHQLALRLHEEQGSCFTASGDRCGLELVPDIFFEHLVRSMASRELHAVGVSWFSNLSPGSWSALWETIRDLKEGSVDPTVALHAVAEGYFELNESNKLNSLFILYTSLLEAQYTMGVGTWDDLASRAMSWAPHSPFLARLQHLCYYGFYDLTAVQLSLFEAVTACVPTTLYFPLSEEADFTFGRQFFERHLSSKGGSVKQAANLSAIGSTPMSSAKSSVKVQSINAIGSDAELSIVCKEILVLVEERGYKFDDIGVVARNLDSYQPFLRYVFDQHRIPFTSTAVMSVIQEPAVKVILELASLSLTSFYWKTMLDVLASPFYRETQYRMSRREARPDLWQLAVRSLAIIRGEEEWHRLASMTHVDVWVGLLDEYDDEENVTVGIGADQLRLLQRLVSELINDCRALPVEGSFVEMNEAFANMVKKHLAIPGLHQDASPPREDSDSKQLQRVGIAVSRILEQLRQFDRFHEPVCWSEWVNIFTKAIEKTTVPIETDDHGGVRVLDAMSARGLPFRALFLVGLNEKVFPRAIREDPFLHDRHRRVLDETLGFKVEEKLRGYDEEVLLCAMLKQAAKERLYLVYQRADREGRLLTPSPFLDSLLAPEFAHAQEQAMSLPRRFSDCLDLRLFASSLLTREELGVKLILQGYDPTSLLEMVGRDAVLFRNGWKALQDIEGVQFEHYDGLIGPMKHYWEQLVTRGLSPTPLEDYAQCPFHYFANHVLRLKPLRGETVGELPAQAIGHLCHQVLRVLYQRLVTQGWPQRELISSTMQGQVVLVAEEVFTAYQREHGTGYALTRQLAKEKVMELVTAILESDRQDFHETGFRPIAFEVPAEGRLDGLKISELDSFKVWGRLDRIDQRESPPEIRIIDYKYKQSRKIDSKDRDLLTSGIRAFRLQPPLYALMRVERQGCCVEGALVQMHPEYVKFKFLAPAWENMVDHSQFEVSAWNTSVGQQLRQTFRVLLNGIHEGQFFILPGGYCNDCDFSTACRRFHEPTRMRAIGAQPAKQLRRIRKQKLYHE